MLVAKKIQLGLAMNYESPNHSNKWICFHQYLIS